MRYYNVHRHQPKIVNVCSALFLVAFARGGVSKTRSENSAIRLIRLQYRCNGSVEKKSNFQSIIQCYYTISRSISKSLQLEINLPNLTACIIVGVRTINVNWNDQYNNKQYDNRC